MPTIYAIFKVTRAKFAVCTYQFIQLAKILKIGLTSLPLTYHSSTLWNDFSTIARLRLIAIVCTEKMLYNPERILWPLQSKKVFIKKHSGFKDAKNKRMSLQVIRTHDSRICLGIP
jgi:hypothetical protein